MSTKRVTIQGDTLLEGLLREGQGKGRVLICHPHSLYGGSMDNNVVETLEGSFHGLGFTTLRFNFRGVGGSAGAYDEGEGEMDDVVAAWDYLKGQSGSGTPGVLAGYSFGAWVCSRAARRIPDVDALFLVAYPFAFYSAAEVSQFKGPLYIVGGSLDEISPLDRLTEFYKPLENEKYLKVVPSSHFFNGFEHDIADFVKEVFSPQKGGQ
jgi:uncharacterized protein